METEEHSVVVETEEIVDENSLVKKSRGRPKVIKEKIVKEKKPPTEKQMAALKNLQEKCSAAASRRKEEKRIAAAKLLLENGIDVSHHKKIELPPKKNVKPALEVDTDMETDEEIVVIKKTPRKKKRRVVVYDDDDDDDDEINDDDDDGGETISRKCKPTQRETAKFKSQQNKKSKTIATVIPQISSIDFSDYFC